MTFENLVFEGGGVKGIAYAGAIQALEDHNLLSNIIRVAGTSAGAITATLVSLRYDAPTITKIIKTTNFKKFEDHWNPLRIVSSYGLYRGDYLLNFIRAQIKRKGLAENATFSDFKNHGCRELRVFASNLNLQVPQEFSFTKTPHVIVAEAVRASMSIPLFFEAMTLSQGPFKNQLFVDGGLTYNYPITTFDEAATNLKTLGFHFGKAKTKPKENALKTDEVLDYTKILFDMLLDTQKIDFEKDPAEKERTINIDDFGISATNFELTDAEKQQLYHAGKVATKHFLKTHETGTNGVLIH